MDLGLGDQAARQAKLQADALKKKKTPDGNSILDNAVANVQNLFNTYGQAAQDLLGVPSQTAGAVNDIQDAANADPAAIARRRKK